MKKFKIHDKVIIGAPVDDHGELWASPEMDDTIGKTGEIVFIDGAIYHGEPYAQVRIDHGSYKESWNYLLRWLRPRKIKLG